jgi:hypothetical protein
VRTVEDQAALTVRRDDHRIALLAFGLDALAQTHEAILVVGLVEDQLPKLYEAQVVE